MELLGVRCYCLSFLQLSLIIYHPRSRIYFPHPRSGTFVSGCPRSETLSFIILLPKIKISIKDEPSTCVVLATSTLCLEI